ncbi:MAG: hypothetical protein ABI388_02550 [Bacteroidia bacterium]
MFKLDRTSFSKGKAESMSNNVDYWQNKLPQERLAAAWYLVCCGFRIPHSTSTTLRLDRGVFSCEKR